MPGPLNYSTTVAAAKTVTECQTILVQHRVQEVSVTYSAGVPAGLSFVLAGRTYRLPVDVPAMREVLKNALREGSISTKHLRRDRLLSAEHAQNVAWRVTKDWLAANLALVAAAQVPMEDIMLPYLVLADGRAVREAVRDNIAALEAPR